MGSCIFALRDLPRKYSVLGELLTAELSGRIREGSELPNGVKSEAICLWTYVRRICSQMY